MSNLSDISTQLAVPQTEAFKLVGNLIGSLADVSGAVGAVVGLIDLFESSNDQVSAELQQLQTAIEKGFSSLQLQQAAADIIARNNSLAPAVAQAQTVVDQLKADFLQHPPVTNDYKLQQIGLCLDAVNQLDQETKWLTVFKDEVYADATVLTGRWQLSGFTPQPNPDGTVFTDRYNTPYFMQVLSMFLVVAKAFDPDYLSNYADPLERFCKRLRWAYDTSADGIRFVNPPVEADFLPGSGLGPGDHDLGGDWTVDSFDYQPYGAVHIYSGLNFINMFAGIPNPPQWPPPGYYWQQIYALLDIQNRECWKKTHNKAGLDIVYDAYAALMHLTGRKGTYINAGTTWTLREIWGYFERRHNAFSTDKLTIYASDITASETIRRLHVAVTVSMPVDPTVAYKGPPPGAGLRQALQRMLIFWADYVDIYYTYTHGGGRWTPPTDANF